MTQYNYNEIKSDSLQQVVKFLDNLTRDYFAEGYASDDYRKTCQCIGALSAVLDKLAEKMGDLWLFGADFVEDADQLRAFCNFVVAKAEKLAELAEVDNLTITDAVARVENWIAKGAETAKYFDEQAKAEAETAEATETATECENECHRLECREGGALVEIATGETVGTWGTDEDGFFAQLDGAHPYNYVHIVNDPTEGTETATESENDSEQDNTPTEAENDRQSATETADGYRLTITTDNAAAASFWVFIEDNTQPHGGAGFFLTGRDAVQCLKSDARHMTRAEVVQMFGQGAQ